MRDNQFILAFDASCGTCRAVSDVVSTACSGRLQTRGLGDPEVAR